jgi:hypothetical protein
MKTAIIVIDEDPIPGTHLHRRYEDGREVCPEYRGPAMNELPVIAECDRVGVRNVKFYDSHYVNLFGQWYLWGPFRGVKQ